MTEFDRILDKAIAEIGIAKYSGAYAEPALVQARNHLNQALDFVRRSKLEAENVPDNPTETALD